MYMQHAVHHCKYLYIHIILLYQLLSPDSQNVFNIFIYTLSSCRSVYAHTFKLAT